MILSTVTTPHAKFNVVESEGGGAPILLLHGTGSSHHAFDRQLQSPLAATHRLVAVDLPGHGDSADARQPARDYTINGLAQSVAELIDALRLERLVIAGWSLGGHIGIELLKLPAVAGLMLSGTPPVGRGPVAMLRAFPPSWDMLLASKERYSARDVARFVSLCFPHGLTPQLLEAVVRADGKLRSTAVLSMALGELSDQRRIVELSDKPVAIVNGRDDPFVRISYLEGLQGLWRGGPTIVEDAGHAVFWDRPEVYNPLLANFAAEAQADWQKIGQRLARA